MYSIVSAYAAIARRLESNLLGPYLAGAAYMEVVSGARIKQEEGELPIWAGKSLSSELGKGKFICKVTGEDGKININTASSEVLSRLTGLDKRECGKITGSILKPFRVKEEILMVEGVTDEIYNNIKDCITVYGDGKVNINVASDKVLESLGMDSELIEMVRELRLGPDGKSGTEDDDIFKSTAEITSSMKWFSEEEKTTLLNLTSSGTVSAESKVLLLEIDTEVAGKPADKYQIVTDGEKILRWMDRR